MSINKIQRADIDEFREHLKYQENTDDRGNSLDEYMRIAGQSAIYPGAGTSLGLAYVALKLNGEAGEFAEHVGKAMRDDNFMPARQVPDQNGDWFDIADLNNQLTMNRRASLIKEIGDVLWYIQAACRELGITMSQAALINLDKLCDRGERNQLQGSGDER